MLGWKVSIVYCNGKHVCNVIKEVPLLSGPGQHICVQTWCIVMVDISELWPCADGIYGIPLSHRCDGSPDCQDASDETGCEGQYDVLRSFSLSSRNMQIRVGTFFFDHYEQGLCICQIYQWDGVSYITHNGTERGKKEAVSAKRGCQTGHILTIPIWNQNPYF